MGVPINNVTRRVVYAASGTGPYAFTFEILAAGDIAVYRDDTLLTLTTDYTVTINVNGTGSVTLTATPTGATQIAIVGNRSIQRLSDFVTGGDLFANTINDELDQQTIFNQQNAEGLQRALQAPQTDPTTINMVLPRASVRANKVLSFDGSGNPSATEFIGSNRGNWAAGTLYYVRDIVKDTSTSNIWQCVTQHTSSGAQPISTNADSAKWFLLVDAAAAGASATAAAASATAAASSASAASTSASNASTSATNAANSASSASTSASNASTSATNAASSASTASTQASNAATSATNAANSATSASNSASTATTQATNASNSASSASTSATNAANSASSASSSASSASSSASNASTSASNASTSATNAASSATAAAASATSAAASYDSFDDRYLGAKTSDPTLDNDGNALLTGALYFNSSTGEMKVYSGSAWVSSFLTAGAQTIAGVKTFSSNPILSGGTANGVAYLNGSKVLTTGSALSFNGTRFTTYVTSDTNTNIARFGVVNTAITDDAFLDISADAANNLITLNSTGNNTGSFAFQTGGSEQMRLTSTGLGIGTSSPGQRLTVAGNEVAAQKINAVGTVYASGAFLNAFSTAGGNEIGFAGFIASQSLNTTNRLWMGVHSPSGANQSFVGNPDATPLAFWTNSVERVRITSAGDVGIGTSSITNARLKVSGSSANGAIMSEDTSGSTSFVRILGDVSSQNLINWQDGTALRFATSTQAYGSFAERMRLDSSGNLGLGVTPSAWGGGFGAMQYVGGAVWSGSGYQGLNQNAFYNGTNWIYRSTAAATNYEQNAGQHRWYSAPSGTAGNAISFTQAMTLDASGNLLLGQTSQDARFNLNGPSTSTSNPQIRIRNSADGSGNSHLDIGYYYQSGVGEYGFIQSFTDYGSAPRDLLLQPRGGNVGIGTTSPGQLLDVSKSQNTDTLIRVTNANTGGSAAAQFFASNGTTQTQFYHLGTSYTTSGVLEASQGGVYNATSAGVALIAANASGILRFATGGTTERARITSGGNVEVNSASSGAGWSGTATRRISVLGGGYAASNSAALTLSGGQGDNNTASGWEIRSTASGATGSLVNTLTFNVTSYTGSADAISEKARITSGGDLLVGKTDVTATTSAGLSFTPGTASLLRVVSNSGTAADVAGIFTRTSGGTSSMDFVGFNYNSTRVGTISATSTTTTYGTSSDYRLKTLIGKVADAGSRIDALNPVEYEWKANGKRTRGFFAHEFQEVYADSVTGTKDAVDEEGKPVYQAMQASSSEVIADLVAEIQSLRARVAQLEAK